MKHSLSPVLHFNYTYILVYYNYTVPATYTLYSEYSAALHTPTQFFQAHSTLSVPEHAHSTHIHIVVPYSGKVWWGESLAKLAKLAKLQVIRQIKPSKVSIQSSSVAISARCQCESSIFAKLSFGKTSRCPIRQTFPPPNFPAIWYIISQG